MPYNIHKIDPRVREGRKALGVRFPFSKEQIDEKHVGKPDASAPFTFNHYRVFTSTYQTKDRIKSNLYNYFMTAKGERYFNPTFGNELLSSIFENYTEEQKQVILEQVRLDLASYFPEIEVKSLTVDTYDNTARLNLTYSIRYANEVDEITIDIG